MKYISVDSSEHSLLFNNKVIFCKTKKYNHTTCIIQVNVMRYIKGKYFEALIKCLVEGLYHIKIFTGTKILYDKEMFLKRGLHPIMHSKVFFENYYYTCEQIEK